MRASVCVLGARVRLGARGPCSRDIRAQVWRVHDVEPFVRIAEEVCAGAGGDDPMMAHGVDAFVSRSQMKLVIAAGTSIHTAGLFLLAILV